MYTYTRALICTHLSYLSSLSSLLPLSSLFDTPTTRMDHERDEKLVFESSEEVSVSTSFDKMGLKEDLIRGIYAYSQCGFQVQTQAYTYQTSKSRQLFNREL